MTGVVALPCSEGRLENVSHQVFGRSPANTAGQVAKDRGGMPLNDQGEPFGVNERVTDEGGIRAGVL